MKKQYANYIHQTLKGLALSTIFVALTGCGMPLGLDHVEKSGGRLHDTTAQVFTSYVNDFEKQAQSILSNPEFKVKDIPVNFGDTENDDFVGVCFEYENGEKEIIIDKTWWDEKTSNSEMGKLARQSLIFHELGHCALNMGHRNEITDFEGEEFKLSLMNKELVLGNDYRDFQSDYHLELFTQETVHLINSLSTEEESTRITNISVP